MGRYYIVRKDEHHVPQQLEARPRFSKTDFTTWPLISVVRDRVFIGLLMLYNYHNSAIN